jgi:predicted aspartyl protease
MAPECPVQVAVLLLLPQGSRFSRSTDPGSQRDFRHRTVAEGCEPRERLAVAPERDPSIASPRFADTRGRMVMTSLPERAIMPDMGTFRTTILIESTERRGDTRTVENALVDTGGEYTWAPRAVLESLAIRPERMQRFVLADGRMLERQLGFAIIHADGTNAPDLVVFAEPGDMVLLGARSLKGMNLRVDALRKQLVPAGPILAAVA